MADLKIHLSEKQLSQFYRYYELLIQWNEVMNLTAITELKDVVEKHFLDSISLVKVPLFSERQGGSIIDVGTGAGFPGIPLKIAFPQWNITLLDSLNKRVKFLNEVTEKLGLSQICAMHGRAEDYGKDPSHREQYDLCVSRAVANISTLSEYCLPFVKTGGAFISYKSGKVEEELETGKKAIFLLGGELGHVTRFQLAGTDADRALVVIHKREKTAKKYPRKAGLPSKEPL